MHARASRSVPSFVAIRNRGTTRTTLEPADGELDFGGIRLRYLPQQALEDVRFESEETGLPNDRAAEVPAGLEGLG